MKRYEFILTTDARGEFKKVYVREHHEAPFLKRDEVIDALEQCGLELDEGMDQVLEALGITKDEYQAAVDRNHPGPDPDYDGSSVLDYSRGVR